MTKTSVVIPNLNGKDWISPTLDSLIKQSEPLQIIVVDNGSTDGSAEFLADNYPQIEIIRQPKNYGFTGGVNPGIQKAIDQKCKYVALLNNDAVAAKDWLSQLVNYMESHPKVGIATSKICDAKKTHLDSTGDIYTIWGLSYPRGRGEKDINNYDNETLVFGASGGASIYRIKMLKEIGIFDQAFFAYYEDIDVSFRAQLAGWKVAYVPSAVVYHEISATSSKMKGFSTYHTLKNLPFVFWKNVPAPLIPTILPRFTLAYSLFFFRALSRGLIWPATKGVTVSFILLPKKLWQRRKIQRNRRVSAVYINSILTHDLPPNARKLRHLRSIWWKLTRSGS